MTKNNPVVVDLDDFAALAATVGKVDPPAGPACIGERPGQSSDGRYRGIHMKSWPKPGGIVDVRAATRPECQAMIEATRARLKRNPEYQWDGADPRAIGGSYLFRGWMGNPVDQFLVYSPEAIRTNRRSLATFESTSRDLARAVAAASPALGHKRLITVPAKPQTTPMDRYWSLYNDALELPALAPTEIGPLYLEQAQRLANAAGERGAEAGGVFPPA